MMKKSLFYLGSLRARCVALLACMVWGWGACCARAEGLDGAEWISAPRECVDGGEGGIPVLRGAFSLHAAVRKAVLRASALGVYDVFVNGRRVEGAELKPGWTDYRKEIAYQEFDVTSLLRQGRNVLGAQLSNGWYGGAIARRTYGSSPTLGFIARLEVTLADGTVQTVVTDRTWKASTCGPVVYGDIYNGETYDARRSARWSAADYDDSAWYATTLNTDPKGTLFRQTAPDVVVRGKSLWRRPQRITVYEGVKATGTTYGAVDVKRLYTDRPDLAAAPVTLKRGETMVIDLGQNMVGWIDFTARGAEGTTLTWRFGEMLNYNGDAARLDKGPAGSVWTHNLRTANATLKYVMSGAADGESFHPSTTWMGFRYVELTADADVTLTDIVGQVVGSDIREHGEFECSDADINRLYANTWWGQRGNFLSIPMDCPQRDERLGWTGDTQIFSRTAMYNADVYGFYRQWMRDMRNGQNAATGAFRDIAPYCLFWGEGNAAWGDAGVIVPWVAYDMTGDKTILEENYEAMKAWMRFCAGQADSTWQYNGAGTSFGDWLSYEDYVKRYVSVTHYAYVAKLMQKAALALSAGGADAYARDAAAYGELYENIRQEFQRRYLNADGSLNVGTQTSYLLALHLGLLPEECVETAKEILRKKIVDNGYKLSTGFVGTGILTTTLSEVGCDDLAYDLLLQRKNPSWLYSIDQGATTIWERWDSYTIESGFNKHEWNMNSFNHYSYGAVCEWMYATMVGIQTPDYGVTAIGESGFRHVVLKPHPDPRAGVRPLSQPRITWARAKTSTPFGDIAARWDIKADNRVTYEVSIPEGTTATVYMPLCSPTDDVTVNGIPLAGQSAAAQAAGVTLLGVEEGAGGSQTGRAYHTFCVMEVAAGTYRFDDVEHTGKATPRQ